MFSLKFELTIGKHQVSNKGYAVVGNREKEVIFKPKVAITGSDLVIGFDRAEKTRQRNN